MASDRTLCDWSKKEIPNRLDELRAIVIDARYICRKCGRVANEERWLCRPLNLYTGVNRSAAKR